MTNSDGHDRADEGLSGNVLAFFPKFSTDEACRTYLEARRWPNGPVCPHCPGGFPTYPITGAKVRPGVHKCSGCRKQFTATVGTIFEGSHIPLPKWFAAIYFMCSSKKGVSAHQIHRSLGITYKSAWFLCHRVREAMKSRAFRNALCGTVEVDETYVGPKDVPGKRGRGAGRKTIVMGVVERGGDMHAGTVPNVQKATFQPLIEERVVPGSRICTGELKSYNGHGQTFTHEVVNQQKEYASGNDIHVNTAESFWALLKRGIHGTFHHVSCGKLDMCCAEFAFRFDDRQVTDAERFIEAVTNMDGRLKWYFGNQKKGA